MDRYQNFINQWSGNRVDYDHAYSYQCVDYVLQFIYQLFGIASGVNGNAIDYWTNPSPRLLEEFDRVASQNPIRGDIVILYGLPGNPDGHIGTATGNNTGTTVEIVEQNGQTGNGDGTGDNAIRTRFVQKNRIAGLLRAHDRNAFVYTPPAPAEPSHPYTVEDITSIEMVADVARTKWNLDETTWGSISSNPAGNLEAGTPVTIVAIAHHRLGSNYYMEDRNVAEGYNVVDLHNYTPPAPAVVPDPTPPPVAAVAPAAPEIVYEKLPLLQGYKAKLQPTNVWGFNHDNWPAISADVKRQLNLGDPFTAGGRAKHSLGGIYMMTLAAFGSADTTGVPNLYEGINIADLEAPPLTPADPVVVPVVETPPAPAEVVGSAPVAVVTPTDVPVATPGTTIQPTQPSPATDWRNTFNASVKPLVAKETIWVKDLEGRLADVKLEAGKLIPKAGDVWKEGLHYVITIPSHSAGNWLGIPISATGPVARNELKKATILVENIWEKYHQKIEDDMDKLFHEGMQFEEAITNDFRGLQRLHGRAKLTDIAARLLFHKNKNIN